MRRCRGVASERDITLKKIAPRASKVITGGMEQCKWVCSGEEPVFRNERTPGEAEKTEWVRVFPISPHLGWSQAALADKNVGYARLLSLRACFSRW